MITTQKYPLFLFTLVVGELISFIPLTSAQLQHHECRQTCGSSDPFPYPFGFSSGCLIRLNCTAGRASVGEFPIQKVTIYSIIVTIEAQCSRPFDTFRQLFSHKYAPTSRNVILLDNCTGTPLPCSIPGNLIRTHFESVGCSDPAADNLTCYFENKTSGFLNRRELDPTGCKYFTSSLSFPDVTSVSGEPLSLEVNTIELGWWVQGDRCPCSDHANCTTLQSPVDGKQGFRCACRDGFVGDGFLAGTGCRKG